MMYLMKVQWNLLCDCYDVLFLYDFSLLMKWLKTWEVCRKHFWALIFQRTHQVCRFMQRLCLFLMLSSCHIWISNWNLMMWMELQVRTSNRSPKLELEIDLIWMSFLNSKKWIWSLKSSDLNEFLNSKKMGFFLWL